jgi:competence protein ComEC
VETSDGVRLDVLHPQAVPGPDDALESAGLVLRLSYRQASFLLTPDLDEAAEAALLASGRELHGTVLQLASHGANRVSSAAFLAAAVPQVAVVQVDPGNRFGHPAADVVARLGNTPLYRTDEQGAVEFATDGQMLWISTSRH